MTNWNILDSKVAPNKDYLDQISITERNGRKTKDESSKAEEKSANSANGGSYKRIGTSLELNQDFHAYVYVGEMSI